MAKSVSPVPEGYASVTPYLIARDADRAIEFYKAAFGATELTRMVAPGGKIGHAELQIGDSKIMLGDEWEEAGFRSPLSLGGSPVSVHLYVADADATVQAAVDAGATLREAVSDMFYGDRMGTIVDPFGHVWHVATHVEDLSEEEIQRRGEAFMAQMAEG